MSAIISYQHLGTALKKRMTLTKGKAQVRESKVSSMVA